MRKLKFAVLFALVFLNSLAFSGNKHGREGPPCDPPKQAGSEGEGRPMEMDDPVLLPRGEFTWSNVDIMLPGRGLSIYLERSYRSRSRVSVGGNGSRSAFGINWSHNYEMSVEASPLIYLLDFGNERLEEFQWNGEFGSNVQYQAIGEHGVITFDPIGDSTGNVLYTTSNNTVFTFHPTDSSPSSGLLQSIKDRNGNTVTVTHEAGVVRDRVAWVSDDIGNTLYFTYYDNENAPETGVSNRAVLGDLLWKVTDHAGREVEYLYDFSPEGGSDLHVRELIEVIFPAHKSDITNEFDLPTEHARFTDGRSTRYEYDQTGGNATGLITKVIDQNGVSLLENFYLNPTFENYESPNSRRLYKQIYAGDTYTHMITTENGLSGTNGFPNTNLEHFAIWVNKRNGTISRLLYTGYEINAGHYLVSRIDYPGSVPLVARDKLVWHDSVSDTWYYADTPTSPATAFTGPINPKRTTDTPIVKNFNINSYWHQTSFEKPNGDVVEMVYNENATDPRSRQALQSITTKPAGTVLDTQGNAILVHSSWITQSFEHEFSFWPGTPGACGCGPGEFATAEIDGNGNRTEKIYSTAIIPPLTTPTGNLETIYHDIPSGSPAGSPALYASAVEQFTYTTGGNLATHLHPETTRLVNGVETTHERLDEFVYYSDSHSNISSRGKLHIQRIDSNGPAPLETVYEYDVIGNISKTTEPDGDVTTYLYNQGRQLVREQHWDSSETDLFAQTDYFYDANGNLVIEKIANIDGDLSTVSGNPVITVVYEYDARDLLITRSIERSDILAESIVEDSVHRAIAPLGIDWVTQRWAYNENDYMIRFEDGEAVRDSSTFNVTEYEYDFRDLLFEKTVGAGSTNELITRFDYDANKRLIERVVNPVPAIGEVAQTESFVYDGHDRLVSIVDPMMNVGSFTYDKNHNLIEFKVCGPVDLDTDDMAISDVNTVLYFEEAEYDSRDRAIERDVHVFDYLSSSPMDCDTLPAGSLIQTTTYSYNEDSSLRRVESSSGTNGILNTAELFYDRVGRREYAIDGDGNSTQYTYDSGSNLIQTGRMDYSTVGSDSQHFVTTYDYDSLDRRVQSSDGVLNKTSWSYDSRSNMTKEVDPRGNVTAYDYDGLSRLVATHVKMTADGDGPELDVSLDILNPDILTFVEYDDSSRKIAEIDDNGNRTEYGYDAANRLISTTLQDSSIYLREYNGNGQVFRVTDARGVVINQFHDRNNRLVKLEVDTQVGPTPVGSLIEYRVYDGLGRMTSAVNKLSETIELTRFARSYDSRGFVLHEVQNSDGANGFPVSSDHLIQYEYDLADNGTRILYPHGRDIHRFYDSVNRLTEVVDLTDSQNPLSITSFEYIGNRLEQRINGNNTQTGYKYNGYTGALVETNDFGFGHVNKITTTKTSTNEILDAFTFTWDQAQNRTTYRDTSSGMKNRRERAFDYDSSDRLIGTDTDFPDPLTDYVSPTNGGVTTYSLDGVHNRSDVSGFESNSAPIGAYSQSVNEVLNNQYSLTPREAGGEWTYLYDDNGNMILKAQSSIADLTGDYVINNFDVSAFTNAFSSGDLSADFNEDGVVNFFDVSAFMIAYNAVSGNQLEHWHYSYDFRNQLVGVSEGLGSNVVSTVTNIYDPAARRVIESLDIFGDGTDVETHQFVYGGASLWEVLEHIDLATDEVMLTHVYGLGIDDEVSYRIEFMAIPEDVWAHRDDLNSLTSITDSNGDVLERYEYGDYGGVAFFDASGLSLPASSYSAQHLYTGRSMFAGTEFYDYRYRIMDPESGRFFQRDPLGYIDSMNVYVYVTSNPFSQIDPYGLFSGLIPGFRDPRDGPKQDPGGIITPNGVPGGGSPFGPTGITELIRIFNEANPGKLPSFDGLPLIVSIPLTLMPGGGEYDDFQHMMDPDSSLIEKGACAGSLVVNVVTLGAAPNFAPIKRYTEALQYLKNLPPGKGRNVTVKTQKEAQKIMENLYPDLKPQVTYNGRKTTKHGYEIHPSDGSMGPGVNDPNHLKYWDWRDGKTDGIDGHIWWTQFYD